MQHLMPAARFFESTSTGLLARCTAICNRKAIWPQLMGLFFRFRMKLRGMICHYFLLWVNRLKPS
jgi:hypothetical protein